MTRTALNDLLGLHEEAASWSARRQRLEELERKVEELTKRVEELEQLTYRAGGAAWREPDGSTRASRKAPFASIRE